MFMIKRESLRYEIRMRVVEIKPEQKFNDLCTIVTDDGKLTQKRLFWRHDPQEISKVIRLYLFLSLIQFS